MEPKVGALLMPARTPAAVPYAHCQCSISQILNALVRQVSGVQMRDLRVRG